ncbi:helix-turn-helix domain-containing protein [Chryseobacterium culicis]|uniref:Helix-turn-helix domain-containing protein n=1 Tax=Chryseobacterium culicis TaxID=680127 RepID=A0A1H6H2P8_CHRCI|nr:hypothetical protein [Chryseobacterium culicis]SEH29959.1 hypothetical protein SAMN05421593_1233 [Chryseobacterium culicis]
MNYSVLITKFWQNNKKEPMGAVTASIYLLLLERWKENEENDFNLSDTEICKYLKISRPTIIAIRQKLISAGMIQFQSKNGLPGHYNICLEHTLSTPSNENLTITPKKKQKASRKVPPEVIISQSENLHSHQSNISPAAITIPVNDNNPSLEEFMQYAKTLHNYIAELDILLKEKYSSWLGNHWKNGYGKPITNWKSSLRNIMPFLQNELQSNNNSTQMITLPTIKPPGSIRDESEK